jgi:hypothetical protein
MKKNFIIGGIILIVLIVSGFLFYSSPQKTMQELSQEQILEIIKPSIQSYCQNLDDAAIYSHCIICGGSYSGELEYQNYLYVENFDEGQRERYKYMIEDKGKYYLITSQIYMIAGRNNRPADSSELVFRLDKEGNILESKIPEVPECNLQ